MMTVLLRREIWDAIDSLLPRHMYYLALSLNRQTGNIFSLRRLRDIVHELSARHTGRHEHTSTSTFKLAHASFDRFRSPLFPGNRRPVFVARKREGPFLQSPGGTIINDHRKVGSRFHTSWWFTRAGWYLYWELSFCSETVLVLDR